MKVFATIVPLLLSAAAVVDALSIWPGDKQAVVYDDRLDIPGASPLQHCTPDHDSDLLTIEHVNLSPNPPLAGATLTIEAVGTFKKEIDQGAYVRLQVKYGLIKLLSTTADLCEQIQNVDMECPIQKGKTTITKEVEMPAQIPPGKYTVVADVFSADDEPITCLTATVIFAQ